MFNKHLLIKLLEKNEMTAYKLWKDSGVAQSTISDIINGKITNPSAKTLTKLAKALNVPVNYFFDETIEGIATPIDSGSSKNKSEEQKDNKIEEYMDKNKLFFSKFEKLNNKDKDKVLKILEMFEDETID
jgi:transcriptional regulator with XRE-family HTH domain